MTRYIYLTIIAIIVFTLNFLYGSFISWFLSITFLVCIIYYVLQLSLENIVNLQLQKINTDNNQQKGFKLYQFGKKWESVLKFICFSIVFIGAIGCIHYTMNPNSKNAWFLNNEYHGLSNTGISFNKELTIHKADKDSNANAYMVLKNIGNQRAAIQFEHFFTPVFSFNKAEEQVTLINNILPNPIVNSFTLQNNQYAIDVKIERNTPSFLKKWFTNDKNHIKYNIQLSCNDDSLLHSLNLKAPYKDNIEIEGLYLEKGMLLFDALLDGYTFDADKEESYLILEHLLLSLENTYILASYENDNSVLKLFPSQALVSLGYQVKIDNQVIPFALNNSSTIPYNQDFFIDFNNQKKLLKIANIEGKDYGLNETTTTALLFDYPNTYMLKSPGKQTAGNKNIRSITNDYNNIINDDIKEGFYFTTYNLNIKESVRGSIDYISGLPNSALSVAVIDYNKSTNNNIVKNNKFGLITDNAQHHYLFSIRDFSDNGFSPEKSTLYLSIIYLAFLIVLIAFPGKNLERIETIILSVILALITVRIIMYWRVATFPPLDNISKYELENTLINFDFLLGFRLPLPLTVIWPILFVIGIILYRTISKGKNNFLDQYIPKLGKDTKTLNKQYLIFLGICMVLHLLNSRIIHFDAFTRIITIIIPLLGYCFFSIRNNYYYQYQAMQLNGSTIPHWLQVLKAYCYYFINNPTAIITLFTIVYFGLFDRGFAILFVLFLLLKNILINFTKKINVDNTQTIGNMLYKPYNYWIFGFLALAAYLTILSFKSLFYYLLTYKLLVIGILLVVLCIALAIIYSKRSKIFKIGLSITILYTLLLSIPAIYTFSDKKLDNIVKHVIYRASIINQPISSLLQENEYESFKTRKIIETAENQWFINSYIAKKFDNSETINLRAHSRIGVDYPTQTRDVVLARYVISEMGNFVMYLILLLILLPMVLYLISFDLSMVDKQRNIKNIGSYAGLLPLLLLFTIALFVWLTATNRFVFFGQDFPFLSLTSKVSVLLPLLLLGITLIYSPTPKHSLKIAIRDNGIKYALFTGLIAVFALTTIKQNELNNENFSIVMNTTQNHIDNDLNNILSAIQDSLSATNQQITYQQLINTLKTNPDFDSLVNDVVKDKYTASILKNLIKQPASAFQLNNPLFITYNNGNYTAMYNKNLFLELPPIENRNLWQGSIIESIISTNSSQALVSMNDKKKMHTLPYYNYDPLQHYQFAILPKNWFIHAKENIGLLNILNPSNSQQQTAVFIYKNLEKNMVQNGTSFVTTINNDDITTIYNKQQTLRIGFKSEGNRFAMNKWINGTYKIIYPLRANNFWMYNFANAVRNTHSTKELLNNNIYITLDYELGNQVQQLINQRSASQTKLKNRRYGFSVIGADGDGNVRFMSDYVANRRIIDPNDEADIFAMQQKQFFYSNARNERDQWGNKNLLNMYLGPGSSIKPLIAASVASQLNAGWEFLQLNYSGAALNNYAGLKFIKPWKNTDRSITFNLDGYIQHSSNMYQSVMLFLGSYPKQAFFKNEQYNLKNVLVTQPGKNNDNPRLMMHGIQFFLPNYNARKGNWPSTDQNEDKKSFFGNNNSLLANGLEKNVNLRTTDKDKLDASAFTTDKVNFVDSTLFGRFSNAPSSSFLWSFPEESYFLQAERTHKEIHQNFNIGIKTATLGGYPLKITPFKMNEMYLSMVNLNPGLRLSIIHHAQPKAQWHIDETWKGTAGFKEFLAAYIMKGMEKVIFEGGTLARFSNLKAQYPGYYFYAKTGTINEEMSGEKSSKRLVLIIADKDMTIASNIQNAKTYALYFTSDQTQLFDYDLLSAIIDKTMHSKSLQYYFKK